MEEAGDDNDRKQAGNFPSAHEISDSVFYSKKKKKEKKKRKMKKKILVDRTLNFKIFERVTCLAVKRLKKNKRETPNAFRFD